jgi:hypothetical protein
LEDNREHPESAFPGMTRLRPVRTESRSGHRGAAAQHKISNFERVAVITTLFAVSLAVGSAIGFGFFLNASSQSLKSDPLHLSRNHLRSDEADVVPDMKRQRGTDAAIRSWERIDSTGDSAVSNAATALSKVQKDISEPSRPAGQADTMEATAAPGLRPTVLPVGQRTSALSGVAVARERSKVASRSSEPCLNDTCRQALAECRQLCDAARSMAVAACPRVSAGASLQQEKTCLGKRDRSRRNCHSGCALRTSQALKAN